MSLDALVALYRGAIEEELRQVVSQVKGPLFEPLHHMLAYHLGWEGEGASPDAGGKRIRPLLVLLSCAAAEGEWQTALPAAASVELVHNFSLIHDDIEDNSPLRRGRPTVWYRWGIPQAINAGDTMFILAHLAMNRLEKIIEPAASFQASQLLNETCLRLTQGQYLDLSYEERGDVALEAYWPMVEGKTAALLAACTQLGALIAGTTEDIREAYRQFGTSLGLAFQAQDDLLGIWGDAALTGKSSESDLITGKKSLPVLYGLTRNGPFAKRWTKGTITTGEVSDLAAQLEAEGARDYTRKTANRLTEQALGALETARPQGKAGEALVELAGKLLHRQL